MSGTKTISFTLNGAKKEFAIAPGELLVKLLRRSGLTGTKEGCDEGTCGACTVIVDGRAVMSCIMPAFLVEGRRVETIEGVGDFGKVHPIQQALADAGAVQCGYCIPGLIMSAKALLEEKPDASDEDIRTHMDGNLCRCTGYEKIWTALRNVRDANQPKQA
ncbi:MAG: (2Fe-2S)-binding protein [Verrucomicrobia bacterium]|nr:(2Fe-2S)-binding protein [Verrucomicrobiota bacterium]MBU1909414.1 (2Fe-2S)-binding protein [Verrucomicrobiota bacterium]